mmetsp:Transcript_6710/g.7280  ORF Transcript_6710/g.7280 Transcript_6710/m.7280 type:complete len:258 (+) Transcript_6710:88-861(+)
MRSFTNNSLMSLTAILCSFNFQSRSLRHAAAFAPTQVTRGITTSFSSFASHSQRASAYRSNIVRFMSTTEEVDPGKVDGTDLRVLKYPHPALRASNAEIEEDELKSGEISKLAKEMFLVMYATEGVGLAAPQVGINKRLMVYNESGDKTKWLQETVMVNPKIIEFSEAQDNETEGCLSFPGMNGEVIRSKWIKVEAQNLKGKTFKKKFKGWEARIFQHEYDHLDGVLYPDRLTEEGKEQVTPRLNELIDDFGEEGAL